MARFFRRGKSKIFFLVSTPAGYSVTAGVATGAPTSGELSAGTDLSLSIATITGFDLTNAPINVPDLASIFQKNIPGEDSTAASSLTMYDDDASNTIRNALAKGNTGYICLCPYGTTVGKRAEVWPVTVTGTNDMWDTGNDAARFVTSFSITDVPSTVSNIGS